MRFRTTNLYQWDALRFIPISYLYRQRCIGLRLQRTIDRPRHFNNCLPGSISRIRLAVRERTAHLRERSTLRQLHCRLLCRRHRRCMCLGKSIHTERTVDHGLPNSDGRLRFTMYERTTHLCERHLHRLVSECCMFGAGRSQLFLQWAKREPRRICKRISGKHRPVRKSMREPIAYVHQWDS